MTETLGIDAQAISRRAHELWLKRGCPTGTPELDWLEAERELRAEARSGDATSIATSSAASRAEPAQNESPRAELRATTTSSRIVAASDGGPVRVPRPRAPRSIVTRAGNAPAARLLLALVPEASPDHAAGGLDRAARRR